MALLCHDSGGVVGDRVAVGPVGTVGDGAVGMVGVGTVGATGVCVDGV
jgi:hypothetical protein